MKNTSSEKSNTTAEEYKVIAIYSGTNDGDKAISSTETIPGYLHLHYIRKDIFDSLPTLKTPSIKDDAKTRTLHQWGTILDKNLEIREPLASIKDITQYGDLGIGSAGLGGKEEKSSFAGGGEVFIIPCEGGVKAFRVTKGQGVFPLALDDKCWTCEVTDNKKSFVERTDSPKFSSRSQLLKYLQTKHNKSEDTPFVATFSAFITQGDENHLTLRSNGKWPGDQVKNPENSLFSSHEGLPVGGHAIDNSDIAGDNPNKHHGIEPSGGAKISFTMGETLNISPIDNRLIALKDNPHKFRKPLLREQVEETLKIDKENHKPILIIGGGIAGLTVALKLAKLGIPCTICDQQDDFLSQTSGATPARVGHGYHYRDLETAILYLQSSITFIKEYCNTEQKRKDHIVSLGNEDKDLDRGLYFISKDSQVPKEDLLKIYEGIKTEYKRLVDLNPSNKVFGEVDEFFQELDLEDFKDKADIDKMVAVIRTQERLLNWSSFSNDLKSQVKDYKEKGLISVMTNEEVIAAEYNPDHNYEDTHNAPDNNYSKDTHNFTVRMKNKSTGSSKEYTATHIINCSWANIEGLDNILFPEAAIEDRTNRLKLIASVELPDGQEMLPCMFTAMGAFSMFSNEGDNKGKITYAPVTNVLDYVIQEFKKVDEHTFDMELREIFHEWRSSGDLVVEDIHNPESWRSIERDLEMPNLYKRWLSEGLNEKENAYFGKKILEGATKLYPALKGAKVKKVSGGIVKSLGEVNIHDKSSNVHNRSDHGLLPRQVGFSDFAGMKLFYGESQSRRVIENLINDIRLNTIIDEIAAPHENKIVRTWQERYAQRYISPNATSAADFNIKSQSATQSATQSSVEYMQSFIKSILDLYIKNPTATLDFLVNPASEAINSVGSATKDIIESGICNDTEIKEKHKEIERSFTNNKSPNLFTAFSIINEKGDIVVDSKYGVVNEECRQKNNIPSLKNRDYVKKMMNPKNSNDIGFTCGVPVIGSTSDQLMVPVGIPLRGKEEKLFLTFGVDIAKFTESFLRPRQNQAIKGIRGQVTFITH